MSSLATVLVAVTVLVAAGVQAATGIGFALVLTPVLFVVLSPTGAIVTATCLGLELNLLVLLAERRRPSVDWEEVLPILAASVPGAVGGVLILRALPKPVLQITVGVLVIAAAIVRVRVQRPVATTGGTVRQAGTVGEGGTVGRLGLGLATGAMTTSSGVSGPPLALWFSHRGMNPIALRDSLSATFLGIGLIAIVALVPVLHRAHLDPVVLIAGVASVIGGHAIGRRVFARLYRRGFEPLLLAVILIAGVASVVAGLGGI